MIQDENGYLLHPMKEGSKIKYGAFDLTISQMIGETIEKAVEVQEYFSWKEQKYLLKQMKVNIY